ncbi:MAG: hypothetical protein ACPGUC_03460, partial [Gammaproteobacteria bacterium]
SSAVAPSPIKVVVLSVTADVGDTEVRVGVFYAGVIAGCNCADDPTPMDEENEYCELRLRFGSEGVKPEFELLD